MRATPSPQYEPRLVSVLPFFMLVGALFIGPILNVLWLSVTDPVPGLGNYAMLFTRSRLAASCGRQCGSA